MGDVIRRPFERSLRLPAVRQCQCQCEHQYRHPARSQARRPAIAFAVAAASLGALFATASCSGQSVTSWLVAQDGVFSDPARWSAGPPVPGWIARFGATADSTPFVVTLAAPAAIAAIEVESQRLALDLADQALPTGDALLLASLTVKRPNGQARIEPALELRNGAVHVGTTATIGDLAGSAAFSLSSASLTVDGNMMLRNAMLSLDASTLHQGTVPQSVFVVGAFVPTTVALANESELAVAGSLIVGRQGGNGTLTVSGGSNVVAERVFVGGESASLAGTGHLSIDHSSIHPSTEFRVGAFGTGTLTLGEGAAIEMAPGKMRVGQGGIAVVAVEGAATVAGNVDLGSGGTIGGGGALTIDGVDAALVVNGALQISGNAARPSSLVVAGGDLTAQQLRLAGVGTQVRVDGGSMHAGALKCTPSPGAGESVAILLQHGASIVAGELESSGEQSYAWELGGGAPSTMTITGTGTLNGTIDVTLVDGAMPPPGLVFTLVTGGSLDGRWTVGAVSAPYGIPGLIRQEERVVDVRFPDHIDGLTISGADSLPIGYVTALRAFASFDGESFDVSDQAVWTVDDSTVVEVGAGGAAIGLRGGVTVVRANFAGIDAASPIAVRALPGLPSMQVISRTPFEQANGPSAFEDEAGRRRVNGDGTMVAYWSSASNLVAGDTNQTADIFAGTATADEPGPIADRVSVPDQGVAGAGGSGVVAPVMSRNGRFVLFNASQPLVAGPPPTVAQTYLRDRLLGITERVSVSTTGEAANVACSPRGVSDDGRFVLFGSYATNLAPGGTSSSYDSFVRDRVLGTTTRVSFASPLQLGAESDPLEMSPDGRFILLRWNSLESLSPPVVAYRLFLVDRVAGAAEEVTAGVTFASGQDVREGSMSDDGSIVAFLTDGSVPGFDSGGARRLYVRDRLNGQTRGVGANDQGVWTCAGAGTPCSQIFYHYPQLNGGGRFLSFVSNDPSLTDVPLPGSISQVFRFDRLAAEGDADVELASYSSVAGLAPDWPEWTSISGDGRTIAFSIVGDGLAPFDSNGFRDVIVRRFGSGVPGDVNGDALVDATDLATLIAAWGTPDRESDLDGDGSVGPLDLALLLGGWSTSAP